MGGSKNNRFSLTIDPDSPIPIYAQIAEGIKKAVATGHLQPGQQLPTVRQLAVDLKINPNTVAHAYGELEKAGIIATRRGMGTFVLPPSKHPPDRNVNLLTELATKTILEAHRLGFTAQELIEAIKTQIADANPSNQ
ncbi:MAG: GntR family transcriptional regulator [Armatimonadota bacterium]